MRIYYKDRFLNDIQKIDKNIYNHKWQKLIDLILETDYIKRIDINKVYNILEKMTISIKGEIYIFGEDINKDIRIINSFENGYLIKKMIINMKMKKKLKKI